MDDNVHLFPVVGDTTTETIDVKDVSTMSFEKDVLQASMTIPVVVIMRTALCATCTQLMPVLKKCVEGAGGRIILAKVDIDQNPELVQALQVQSTPTVLAFYQGQPVDGFIGIKPESEIKSLLDGLLLRIGDGNTQAAGLAEQIAAFLEQADTVLAEGDWQTAMSGYMQVLETAPENMDAVAGLIRAQVAGGHIDEAKALLERFIEQTTELPVQIKPLRTLLHLIEDAPEQHSEDMPAPKELQDYYDFAMALFKEGVYDQSVFSMLEIIRKDRNWEDGKAKAQLLRIFEALGDADDVTISGRRQLSSILFS